MKHFKFIIFLATILILINASCLGDGYITQQLMTNAAREFPFDRQAQEARVKAQMSAYIDIRFFLENTEDLRSIDILNSLGSEFPYDFILQRVVFYEIMKADLKRM